MSLFTKIFTLATSSFILVRILYEFAMAPDLCILQSPREEESHSSTRGDKCTYLAAQSSKRLNHLPVIILVCLGNTPKNKTER